jgi:hypothetical protein
MPESDWIVRPGAFEPLVDPVTFAKAQKIIRRHCCDRKDEELLDDLQTLLASEGRLSASLIKRAPDLMTPGTYSRRFGGLRNAYKLVGYAHSERLGGIDTRRRTMALHEQLVSQIAAMFPKDVSVVRTGALWRSRLRLFNRLTVSVHVVRSEVVWKTTRRWIIEPAQNERKFITLLARLDESNRTIIDLHVLPNLNCHKKIQVDNAWLSHGKRLNDLSQFCEVVAGVNLARRQTLKRT